jgi:hypothetical protein
VFFCSCSPQIHHFGNLVIIVLGTHSIKMNIPVPKTACGLLMVDPDMAKTLADLP